VAVPEAVSSLVQPKESKIRTVRKERLLLLLPRPRTYSRARDQVWSLRFEIHKATSAHLVPGAGTFENKKRASVCIAHCPVDLLIWIVLPSSSNLLRNTERRGGPCNINVHRLSSDQGARALSSFDFLDLGSMVMMHFRFRTTVRSRWTALDSSVSDVFGHCALTSRSTS
jgi:hypothetical protein